LLADGDTRQPKSAMHVDVLLEVLRVGAVAISALLFNIGRLAYGEFTF
jgi:hypothetical protein